jgi:elongation factor Tu
VVTGRIEEEGSRSTKPLKSWESRATQSTVVTGVEMFRKLLDEGQAGDNVGILLRGIEKDQVERGQALMAPDRSTPHGV